MKKIDCSILVCALVALATLAGAEDNSAFIVRGEDATIEQYPYMAIIFNQGRFTCTGAIISPRSVLTVRKVEWEN